MPDKLISTKSEIPSSFMVSKRQACSRGSDSLYIFWPCHLLRFFKTKLVFSPNAILVKSSATDEKSSLPTEYYS